MNPTANDQSVYETVLVANIDIACDESSVDIVKVSNRVVDDEGNVASQIYDKHEEWQHADHFMVKYDGKPYIIEPGKTKHLPRFVAEHFAKHLADHLLQKMEKETGRKGLVQSSVERPKMLSQILTEMNDNITPEVSQAAVEQPVVVDTDPVVDAGIVPNTALGELKAEPLTLAELLKVAGEDPDKIDRVPLEDTSIIDDNKPTPTRKQLIELCYDQSIEITGTENKAMLIEKLKRG
jgi:hypothetical protein